VRGLERFYLLVWRLQAVALSMEMLNARLFLFGLYSINILGKLLSIGRRRVVRRTDFSNFTVSLPLIRLLQVLLSVSAFI
jgi:hypothetical protein